MSEHSIEPVFFCRVCSKQVPLARQSRIYCSGRCREIRRQVKKHRRANTLPKAAGDALRAALIPIEEMPASVQALIKAKKVPVLYQDRTVYPRALDRDMAELYAQQIYEKSHTWDIPVNVNKTALGRILTNRQVFNYCGTINWHQNQFGRSNAYNRLLWLKYQTDKKRSPGDWGPINTINDVMLIRLYKDMVLNNCVNLAKLSRELPISRTKIRKDIKRLGLEE